MISEFHRFKRDAHFKRFKSLVLHDEASGAIKKGIFDHIIYRRKGSGDDESADDDNEPIASGTITIASGIKARSSKACPKKRGLYESSDSNKENDEIPLPRRQYPPGAPSIADMNRARGRMKFDLIVFLVDSWLSHRHHVEQIRRRYQE